MPLPRELERAFDSAIHAVKVLSDEIHGDEMVSIMRDTFPKAEDFEMRSVVFSQVAAPVSLALHHLETALKVAEEHLDPPSKTEREPKERVRRSAHSEVHSFIFPKQEWTPVTARAWLRDHKKQFGKMDVVGSSFHFKQTDTAEPDILGTIVIQQSPRIMATLEPRKP